MKKSIENFSYPINSDLDLMWLITNLYLEQGRQEYKLEIEKLIKTTHDLILKKIESNQVDPEIFSIVASLKESNQEYFKGINAEHIDKAIIETLRSMLGTLRHTQVLR